MANELTKTEGISVTEDERGRMHFSGNVSDRPNAMTSYKTAKMSAEQLKQLFDDRFDFLADKHNALIEAIDNLMAAELGEYDTAANKGHAVREHIEKLYGILGVPYNYEGETIGNLQASTVAAAQEIRDTLAELGSLTDAVRSAATSAEEAAASEEAAANAAVQIDAMLGDVGDINAAMDELLSIQEAILEAGETA